MSVDFIPIEKAADLLKEIHQLDETWTQCEIKNKNKTVTYEGRTYKVVEKWEKYEESCGKWLLGILAVIFTLGISYFVSKDVRSLFSGRMVKKYGMLESEVNAYNELKKNAIEKKFETKQQSCLKLSENILRTGHKLDSAKVFFTFTKDDVIKDYTINKKDGERLDLTHELIILFAKAKEFINIKNSLLSYHVFYKTEDNTFGRFTIDSASLGMDPIPMNNIYSKLFGKPIINDQLNFV